MAEKGVPPCGADNGVSGVKSIKRMDKPDLRLDVSSDREVTITMMHHAASESVINGTRKLCKLGISPQNASIDSVLSQTNSGSVLRHLLASFLQRRVTVVQRKQQGRVWCYCCRFEEDYGGSSFRLI